jgi:hypothetical protein
MIGWEILNLKRRIDKLSESSTELAAHTQILNNKKQLNGRNHHIPPPSKVTVWQNVLKSKT